MESLGGASTPMGMSHGAVLLTVLSLGSFIVSSPIFSSDDNVFWLALGPAAMLMPFATALFGACLVCSVLLSLQALRHPESFTFDRSWVFTGAVVYLVGGLMAPGIPGLSGLFTVQIVLGALEGAGLAALVVAWGFISSSHPLKQTLEACSAALIFGGAASIGIFFLPPTAGEICRAVLLILGMVGPLRAARRENLETGASAVETDLARGDLKTFSSLQSLVLCPMLGCCLLVFFFAAKKATIYPWAATGLAGLAVAGMLILLLLRFRPGLTLGRIKGLYLPVIAAAFIVCAYFPVGQTMFFVSYAISNMLIGAVFILTIGYLGSIARTGEFSPTLVYGALACAIAVSAWLGILFPQLVPDDVELGGRTLLIIITAYSVLMIMDALFAQHRLIRSIAESDAGDDVGRRCHGLAARAGLSERETEILVFLGRGHNPAYIAGQLFISESTVRTHVRNIYRKLDIGSREDLVQLLEESRRG